MTKPLELKHFVVLEGISDISEEFIATLQDRRVRNVAPE
jgi:hypothetical protein